MESSRFFAALARYWFVVVVATLAAGGAAWGVSGRRHASYTGALTVNVATIMRSGSTAASLQAVPSENVKAAVATVQQWMADPNLVEKAFEGAGQPVPASISGLQTAFKVTVPPVGAASFTATYEDADRSVAGKVLASLSDQLAARQAAYNAGNADQPSITLAMANPVVEEAPSRASLTALLGLLAGALLGLAIVALLAGAEKTSRATA